MSACHGSELERRFSVFAAHTGAAPTRTARLAPAERAATRAGLDPARCPRFGSVYFFAAAAAGAVPT